MKRDAVVEKILAGIIKAQEEYLKWENVSVSHGPEYLLTVNIAKELATLGDNFKPSLEINVKNVAQDAGITSRLSHSKRCITGRGDIVIYKNEIPFGIIEVKNGVYRLDKIKNDIERIDYLVSKQKSKTSWKFGIIAFLIDIDLLVKENQDIVQKLKNKISNLFEEARKKSDLVRDYHYDIKWETYELNGKQRIWAWSPVCITFS